MERIDPKDWPAGQKQCSQCLEMKEFAKFGPLSTGKFGVKASCKQCRVKAQQEYKEANRKQVLAGKRAHYATNREAIRAKQNAYRAENRDTILASRRASTAAKTQAEKIQKKIQRQAYYKMHRETIRAKQKAHREANKERALVKQKAYCEAHKEKIRAWQKAYREAHKSTRADTSSKQIHPLPWPDGHKPCSTCGEMKPFTKFFANVRRLDGTTTACKACYQVKHQRRYKEHKESILNAQKAWYMANREIIRVRVRGYRKTPHGKAAKKVGTHKRRVRGQFAFDRYVSKKDVLRWEKEGAVCYLTRSVLLPGKISWDHVVPLHWGGTSDAFNFLPCSRSENSRKGNRIVYFDLATREAKFTLDPSPGGSTWPRLPLTQPTLDEMEAMVTAWKARRTQEMQNAA